MSARRTSAGPVALSLLALALAGRPASAQIIPTCEPAGIFAAQTQSDVGKVQRHVESADLNGDGLPDLVISTDNSIVIAFGAATELGTVTYTRVNELVGYDDATGTAIADFDSDGIKDIALGCDSYSQPISLFRGLGSNGVGNGQFERYGSLPGVNAVWDLAAVDLNADGILDLVAGSRAGSVHYFVGNGADGHGNGSFTPVGSAPTNGASCKGIDVADLDLDGILDVVVAGDAASVAVLRGGGANGVWNGTFVHWFTAANFGRCFDVTVADFNRDGFPDIATASYDAHSIGILRGPNFTADSSRTSHPSPGYPLGIAAKDFDDDGFPDLVVAAAGSGASFVYFRNSGVFTESPRDGFRTFVAYGLPRVAYNITAADLDLDGDPDVLVPALGQNAQLAAFNLCGHNALKFLSIQVTGQGSVMRSPDQSSYPTDTVVELTAVPAPDWSFFGWSGGATGYANPTTITMDHHKVVIATFLREQTTLSVNVAGPGQGSVSRSPDRATYDKGSTVLLTATPLPGNVFAGWSGDVTALDNPLNVLMDGNKSVTARFVADVDVAPQLVSVTDVLLDQGGAVKLRWLASPLEIVGADPELLITRYRIWRELAPAEVARANASSAGGADLAARVLYRNVAGEADYTWELLADLPAGRLSGYSYVAATTDDSTASGYPETAYMVQAVNGAGTRWFDSPPDSGYSVDNLPPSTPGPVVGLFEPSRKSFHWGPSRAPDLHSYRVHRSSDRDFIPGVANLIAEPVDTVFVDDVEYAYYYKFAAIDIHGNVSHYILVTPDGPVATLVSLVSVEARADRISFRWYASEMGIAATVYRRTVETDWVAVARILGDGSGYLRFEDTDVERGRRYGYRLGILDGPDEAFFEEHWVQAEELRFALEGVIPNPSPAGQLSVQLVMPSASPATLELLDVSGRRLGSRVLAGQTGRQRITLTPDARLRSGLYFIRLRQAGLEQCLRAVVVE